MPEHTSRNLRKFLNSLALAGGSLVISLLLAEGAYRLIKPLSTQINHVPTIYQPDKDVGWRFVPYSSDYLERYEYRVPIEINGAGFRDDEFSPTPAPGVTRIAAVGDSFTAGFQVDRGFTFPDVLESELNESGLTQCPCEVLNFGIPDTGTVQQARLLEKTVLQYQPDIVIVGFYKNDVADAQREGVLKDTYQGYILQYQTEAQRKRLVRSVGEFLKGKEALRFGMNHSYLVRALYNTWLESEGNSKKPNLRDNKLGRNDKSYTFEEAHERIYESIGQMQEACREAGCDLVFVMIPGKEEVLEGDEPHDGPVVEALAERDVPTLELRETFRQHASQGEVLYWEYDGHNNEAGYHLMAEEIAAFLQYEGLLID